MIRNCQAKRSWKNNGVKYLKAAVLTAPETIKIKELPSLEPAKGEVLLQITEVGTQAAIIYKDELFRVAIDLLNKRAIQTDLLINGTCPVEELAQALADFPSPDLVK